jgi:hypothetical protein
MKKDKGWEKRKMEGGRKKQRHEQATSRSSLSYYIQNIDVKAKASRARTKEERQGTRPAEKKNKR